MLDFLEGIVEEKIAEASSCVLHVSGIGGFYVLVSAECWMSLELTKNQRIYISSSISSSPESIKLYGFSSKPERAVFEFLSTVRGVGGKAALAILNEIRHIEQLLSAIEAENISLLSSTPGIGKKTAERIIFELKPKLAQFQEKWGIDIMTDKDHQSIIPPPIQQEVREVLSSLGYQALEIEQTFKKVQGKYENTDDLLRDCLKSLSIG